MELGLKLSQTTALTPQMEQSVRILQMDSMQLNEYLKEVMLENPVIEFEQPREKDPKEDLALRKLEWLESQTVKQKENVGYYDEEDDGSIMEKTVAACEDESLVDHLLAQAALSGAQSALLPVVHYVIGCIDENGYLTASREEMREESGFDSVLIEQAVAMVQGFDPAGVGAADLSECLRLQLGGDDPVAQQLIDSYLEEIAKNRQSFLAKQLGVSAGEISRAIECIRRLNPKPGALYGRQSLPAYITPDVVVTNFENQYYVMLCEFSYPEIRLSDSYLRMARETSDKEVVDYINTKVGQVNWIKKCIESRNKTLLAVARAIVKKQERFFRYGPQCLNVLRMRDVAEMVELHESTVSRAVKDKYLQCGHGVYPLRHFFVKGMENDGDGATSTHDIKEQIRVMIDTEDKAEPFSDQKISNLLHEKGVAISRRTVAKYREELGIAKSGSRVERS